MNYKSIHILHSLPDEKEMGEDGLLLCYDLLNDASFCNTVPHRYNIKKNILHVPKDLINY